MWAGEKTFPKRRWDQEGMEEVGLRMVFQGGDGAREKVGLGGDDPWEPGRGIWSGGQVGKKLSLGELGEA
jgi:hypothetical protein